MSYTQLMHERNRVFTGESNFYWVTGQWTRIDIGVFTRPTFPTKTFGRIVEHTDHLLFEDERDATAFQLGVSG